MSEIKKNEEISPLNTQYLYIQDILSLLRPYGSRSTVFRWVQKGLFPKPISVLNRSAWLREDVLDWQNNLAANKQVGTLKNN